jgi:hypothetical protein
VGQHQMFSRTVSHTLMTPNNTPTVS